MCDATAPLGDRHDAAMDLGAFDTSEVEEALLEVIFNFSEDEEVADAAGESLSSIWARSGRKNTINVASIHPAARKFFVDGMT
jgi:hypothetical protein